jgi:hypothetical protein
MMSVQKVLLPRYLIDGGRSVVNNSVERHGFPSIRAQVDAIAGIKPGA